jgi:6-methylpretetramide 4-monooxygenase
MAVSAGDKGGRHLMNSSDVIIVGAGIGGAVLALAMGTRGWKVTVLEREAEAPRIVRPEVLWGATPTALDSFGVGDVIRTQTSIRLQGVEVCRGSNRLLTLTHHNLRTARVEAYSTDPGQTRAVIAAAASATGNVTFLRGVEVQQVVREGNRVVGVQAHREGRQLVEQARLVVGDDGAKSVVRGALSPASDLAAQAGHNRADIALNIFPVDFITAAIAWPNELPTDQARVWINPQAFRQGIPAMGCLPWPGGRGVLLMPLPHARAVALLEGTAEAFWSELARLTPLAATLSAQLSFPDDFRRVQRPYGHAPQYVANGAAIIGDAAHPVSPAGGQGANASIWDALTLADVAHEALTADDISRERLARYEALRRPRNRDSVRITQRVVQVFQYAPYVPGLEWLIPALLRCLDLLSPLKSHLVSSFATTFVTRKKA